MAWAAATSIPSPFRANGTLTSAIGVDITAAFFGSGSFEQIPC